MGESQVPPRTWDDIWQIVDSAEKDPAFAPAIAKILAVDSTHPLLTALPATIERGLPGDPQWKSSYYRMMLSDRGAPGRGAGGVRQLFGPGLGDAAAQRDGGQGGRLRPERGRFALRTGSVVAASSC